MPQLLANQTPDKTLEGHRGCVDTVLLSKEADDSKNNHKTIREVNVRLRGLRVGSPGDSDLTAGPGGSSGAAPGGMWQACATHAIIRSWILKQFHASPIVKNALKMTDS